MWTATRHVVRPGDHLLLFTDGVLEAPGVGERFDEEPLRELLHRMELSAEEAMRAIEEEREAFMAGPHGDDVALVALRRR